MRGDIDRVVAQALGEDLGQPVRVDGDITSRCIFSSCDRITAAFVARQPLCVAGIETLPRVFARLSRAVRLESNVKDGDKMRPGQCLATIYGPTRAILAGERTALNLLQHLSGIATLTSRYVEAIAGTQAMLRDTRKTVPGLRALEKYAVRMGGGVNHRMGLHDAVLIKDNHRAAAGGIAAAVSRVRAAGHDNIQVECDDLTDVETALALGVNRLLLDNMSTDMLRRAVTLCDHRAELEASGGVTLDSIGDIARTGVDFISVGRLTQSAPAVDIGLDIQTDDRT